MTKYERDQMRREQIARLGLVKTHAEIVEKKHMCDWCGFESSRIPQCTDCERRYVCVTCALGSGRCMYCDAKKGGAIHEL